METFASLTDSPWVMMTLGLFAHLLFKAMKGKDTTKRKDESFSVAMFLRAYFAPLLFSVIASFVFTAISIDKGWPVWSSFFMSMASSSALYNIYPVIANPKLWTSLAATITGKASGQQTPPNDDQQP